MARLLRLAAPFRLVPGGPAFTKGRFTALLRVEPVFFEGGTRMRQHEAADALWPVCSAATRATGGRLVNG